VHPYPHLRAVDTGAAPAAGVGIATHYPRALA